MLSPRPARIRVIAVSRRTLVASSLAGMLVLRGATSTAGARQEAAATPTPSIRDWVVALVVRRFGGTGAPSSETADFGFWAFAFDSVEHARIAFPVTVHAYRDLWRTELKSASAPAIGDERVAYEVVDVRKPSAPDAPSISYGLLVWRKGEVIVVASGSDRESPLPELIALADRVAEREPGGGPVVRADGGFNTGGIWDVLPTPEEMPAGIEFELDFDHLR
jgi:hypothetical protein